MPPVVSVVIPTRDRVAMLRQALASVLRQDVDLEVIVVDEGSSDGTAEMLASVADPRVHVIRHEGPRGVCAARNAGIERARGRVLGFLDDDDIWFRHKLRAQLATMDEVGANWAFGGALMFSAGPVVEAVLPPPSASEAVARLPYVNVVPGGGSNVIVSREALAAIGGFDPAVPIVEDWDLSIRLTRYGTPAVVDSVVLGYRRHGDNASRYRIDRMLASVRQLDVRYRDLRDGEPLDWADLHRWVCHDALRIGDRRTALRMGFGSARAGHAGGIGLALRSALPFRRRPPVRSRDEVTGWIDRLRPPRIVAWPPGTEAELRELLGEG